MLFHLTTLQSLAIILIFFFGHWYTSLFFQSFFYHRYAAHQQFTMSKFWERFFFFLAYIFQGSSYLNIKGYAVMHRLHHSHTDTPEDPHSPSYQKSIWKMMVRTKDYYADINHDRKTGIDEHYYKNIPSWDLIDNFGDTYFSRISWGAFYAIFYILFATQWWMFLLLPIQFIMGPFHGAIINWFAHKIGYMNYRMKNTSTNIMNWDIFMWGEGLHNNHHRKPYSANFAQKWFELDPLFPIIKVFHWLHIIRLRPMNIGNNK